MARNMDAGCAPCRRTGVVLLEVLVAAAILATVALAVLAMSDRCLAREVLAEELSLAGRFAENVIAEMEMPATLERGDRQGTIEGIPGARYDARVDLALDAAEGKLYRIEVRTHIPVAGEGRTFSLEKWVFRADGG